MARPDASRVQGWPITRLLPLVFAGLIFVAVAPVVALGYFGAHANYVAAMGQSHEVRVELIARRLRAHLEPIEAQLRYMGEALDSGAIDPDDAAQWSGFTRGLLAGTPQALGFVVVPVEGEALRFARADGSVRPEPRASIPLAAEILARARGQTGPAWGAPIWSLVFDEPVLPIVAPIRVRGEFRGFLGLAIGVSDLSRFLAEIAPGSTITPFVLIGRDRVLAHPFLATEQGRAEARTRKRISTLAEVADPVLAAIWAPGGNELAGAEVLRAARGHWNWVGDFSHAWLYREVSDYGPEALLVGFHEPGTESARARWIVRGIAIAGLVLLVAAAWISVGVGRRLARPVLALADAAAAVERLDLDRLPPLARGPIRELNVASAAFNRMASGLRLSAIYLPRALVGRLTSSGAGLPPSEDRDITVMFTDLEGYTTYSRGKPAAQAAAYLDDLLAQVGPVIEASGGTIDKYMGDGLMAFWGAPDGLDGHARAACAAALDIDRAVTAFNAARRARGEPACRMRIGLHTGMALVGNIGFPGRVNYTATGEMVNVAARLEQFGRRAPRLGETTIVVSASTRAACGDGFAFEPLDGGPADVAADGTLPLAVLRGRHQGDT